MPAPLDIQRFTDHLRQTGALAIDVRTPKEFAQGHIPGAVNVPLFNNEERAIVGTVYKQQGRQPAILKGLELIGPRMASLVQDCSPHAVNNTLYIHCWRGGMRSGSVAWLMEMYGFTVYTLKGGYKWFRRWASEQYDLPLRPLILGGQTGAGKTETLHALSKNGQQVIDLEQMACHKGSSFGALGETTPPTQEQFENNLAWLIATLDPAKPVWLEDESRLIGKKVIPEGLWTQMRRSPLIYVDVPFEERAAYLTRQYGQFRKEDLAEAIQRIGKRLGPQHMKQALIDLEAGNLQAVCETCLRYYDRSYEYGLSQRDPASIRKIPFSNTPDEAMLQHLTDLSNGYT